jgi:hypothetical protein
MGKYEVNGKELNITPASFAEVMELKSAVLRAVSAQKPSVGENILDVLNTKTELTGEMLDSILQAALSVAADKEVERLLMACARRATIGGIKPDAEYFEDANNRADYYPAMFYVLKENLAPFFGGVFSLLKNREKTPTKNQK